MHHRPMGINCPFFRVLFLRSFSSHTENAVSRSWKIISMRHGIYDLQILGKTAATLTESRR